MTTTARWLFERRAELRRVYLAGSLLFGVGLVLVALAGGVIVGRLGLYRIAPLLVFAGWLAAIGGMALAVLFYRTRSRSIGGKHLARSIERATGARNGFLSGLVDELPQAASSELGAMADTRAANWLSQNGTAGLDGVRRQVRRGAGSGAVTAAMGLLVFMAAGPTSGGGLGFWHPVALVREANGPITVSAANTEVQFNESVSVLVAAAGRNSVTLWQRAPGEAWTRTPLELDERGRAAVTLGPLRSDRFVRATAGSRQSDTLHLSVALPALLTDLNLVARYPAYLGLRDEPLAPGDSVLLPVGTRVTSSGRTTLALSQARWERDQTDDGAVEASVDGTAFEASWVVRSSATWRLNALTKEGRTVDAAGFELPVIALPDSFPEVTIAVPGRDTTPPTSLRQPLVVDVRDDHLLTRVELVSRRSGSFATDNAHSEDIPLPTGGTDRTILQWVLDLNDRGFAPGDTAFYRIRVWDNSPAGQMTQTEEYTLRLPSRSELRDDVRDRSDAVSALADSLARAQAALNRLSEELAAERNRVDGEEGQLDFNSAERAGQMEQEQSQLVQEAEQLQEQISDLADLAREAGITDPEFFEQLNEIKELLQRALSNDLQEKLQELRDALERLDSRSTQEALDDLQQSQEEMREQLERSRDLFERAALEGELSALADEAQELAEQQQAWNDSAAVGDSSMAGLENELAARTDSLQNALQELAEQMNEMGAGEGMQTPQQNAGEAASQMREAAQMASQGDMQSAQQSGESAGENLDDLPQEIREQRDEMRDQWRQEVLDVMDRALSEVAELAQRQSELAQSFESGDVDPALRGDQAAVRDGVERVIEELQNASSMNALVSPRLSTSLGFSMVKMTEALQQLAQASPNAREAAEAAGAAVDGLNQVAHGLVRGRSDVEGSESGSGLEEALERLTQMAQQQQGLNGEANQLLPMMSMGGDQLIQQLRELAMQQMQLADELERIQAEDDVSGLDELADEARDISGRLEAAQLDRATIRRQEQLFRRMLDAGRTLRSDRPDQRLERRSETATDAQTRVPDPLAPGAAGAGPRFQYPGWESLSRLSPEERRLVLDYFRRLNDTTN